MAVKLSSRMIDNCKLKIEAFSNPKTANTIPFPPKSRSAQLTYPTHPFSNNAQLSLPLISIKFFIYILIQ